MTLNHDNFGVSTSLHKDSISRIGGLKGPIRVLHILDKLGVDGSSVHGVTQAIAWWIPRFDQQKFHFHVVSLRGEEKAGEVFLTEGIGLTFLGKSKFDPTTVTELMQVIRRQKPHILHLHGFGATTFGRIVSKMTGLPHIVHEHSTLEQPWFQTVADTMLAPLTDRAIAISPPVYDYMIKGRKIAADKLETFFYGVPLEDFTPSDDAVLQQKRLELGLKPEHKVICTIGRLATQKGQIYLLQAAVRVLESFPDVRFLLVGDGPDLDMLKAFATQQGIAEQVVFAGYRADVADVTALADIIAIPSMWEGGPITLFEAMQVARPVVGTPVGMMADVIEEGRSGFVVPCGQAEPLAEKILYLLQHPEAAQAMGRKGQQLVANYNLQHSVDRLSAIYETMARRATS